MVQLYIKHTDNEFYLLDLEESEIINFKITVKDLNDISKVYAPFTQSFSLKATDKNKMLCGFVGNEKIQRVNTTGEFIAKIYISGFLFQTGILTFEETNYSSKSQTDFKTTFASNLTGLTDILGDSTIQDLFKDENGNFDPAVLIPWNTNTLRNLMTAVDVLPLANDVSLKVAIPFISNNRVWVYDDENLGSIDNIAYQESRAADSTSFINLQEVRPAINYMAIMQHLLLKIGRPVICPAFDRTEVKDLFTWCNSESLTIPDAAAYPLINYSNIGYDRRNVSGDAPLTPKWVITGGGVSGVFNIERVDNTLPNRWGDGVTFKVKMQNPVALDVQDPSYKIIIKDADSGGVITSQDVSGNDVFSFLISDDLIGIDGEINIRLEILPNTLMSWDRLDMTFTQFYYDAGYVGGVFITTKALFEAAVYNLSNPNTLGGGSINLITCLPKMKCTDFLVSFFKTFNIMVVSTGLDDGSMYWLTPEDLETDNKPYSKRIVDYTPYVDLATVGKKKGNEYNTYLFSHFKSKYYESLRGDGTYFGSLTYPEVSPLKPNKFEVATQYSILKQSSTFNNGTIVRTCLGFTTDTPTVLDNGANRYKPVYEEFTLFCLRPVSMLSAYLACENTETNNAALFNVLEASFKNRNNNKTLAFGAEDTDTNSLYLNYYSNLIEQLLNPNTYKSEFNLTLPPNEIFLNFANLNQGESEIPTGFRAQNEIIIGEQRYKLVDSSINLTNGKTKLNLLNF